MQEATKNMTSGSPIRLIFTFSLPLMVGNVFQQGYMIVDSIIVGRAVGVQALASLGASDWINWMMLWTIQGFAQGVSVLIAQRFGAGDHKQIRSATAMIVLLCAALGVILTVCGLLVINPLLNLLHTEDLIIGGARLYLRVMFAGTAAVLAYNVAAAILRCLGDSRTPLRAMMVAAATNVGLDLLFVIGFHWGIFGAAFATVLAQLFAFLYCLWAMRKIAILRLQKEDWRINRPVLQKLCHLGIPTALQNGIISFGGMVVQFVLNGFGFVFVAGFTATNKLYGVLESTAIAFGYAMTAYMGQNRGARRADRIDAGMRAVVLLSVAFSLTISGAMLLFGRQILGLFVSATEASAAQVIEIAYRYLRIMSSMLIFLFFIHAYRCSLQGLGQIMVPAISSFVELAMRIGVALLLPRLIGQSGIFFAEVAAWTGAAVFMMIYYYASIGNIKCAMQQGPACQKEKPHR